MAQDEAVESDKRIGVAVVLGALALGGAGTTLVASGEVLGAYGFAVAVGLGCVLVVALHAYAPR